jgi:hypothetical protein
MELDTPAYLGSSPLPSFFPYTHSASSSYTPSFASQVGSRVTSLSRSSSPKEEVRRILSTLLYEIGSLLPYRGADPAYILYSVALLVRLAAILNSIFDGDRLSLASTSPSTSTGPDARRRFIDSRWIEAVGGELL